MFNDQDDSNSCGSILLVDACQIFEVSENEVSLVALFSPVPFTFVNDIRVYYTSSHIYIHNILYISIYTYTHTSYIKSAYNRYFPQILVLVLVHGTLQLDACPYQQPP